MTNAHEIPFQTADGVANVISVYPNKNSDDIILCLPAMGVAAKQYIELLKELNQQGFNAACYDLRGNGRCSIRANRNNNFGYAELAEVDLPAAISALQGHYPNKKLVLLGHSLGGQICSLYLSQNQAIIENLVLVASCSVYYKNWPSPYRWGLLLFSQFAWLISSVLGYFPGRSLGFGGREAQRLMQDWARNARSGNYNIANSKASYFPFPGSPDTKVLAINFADDQLAPRAATNHLLSKLGTRRLSKRYLSGNDIGRKTADHFNWLKSPKKIAETISEYLSA